MNFFQTLLTDFWEFTKICLDFCGISHESVNLDISSGLGAPISEAELRIDLIWSP